MLSSSEARLRAKEVSLGFWLLVAGREHRRSGFTVTYLLLNSRLLAASKSRWTRFPVGDLMGHLMLLCCFLVDLGVRGAISSFSWFDSKRLGMQGGSIEEFRWDKAWTGW